MEGSRVVSKEYNIIIDDDDDDSNTDDLAMNGLAATSSTAMEMTDIHLEQLLSPRFHHRNLESVKPVEEIFSLDKSYTRGLFAWSRRMVERRISSSLLGRHLKVVIPIVLTSVVGVVLSLLVATSDKQGKTLLSAEDNLNEEDETSDDR
jgi:ABC-type sulfate transport system permease subunit